jgi:hypothetical protein
MGNKTSTDNWGARERLIYLDRLAYWRGWVRRGDLCDRFGISVPQASADISEYLRLSPRALRYDLSQKRYVASPTLKPLLARGGLEEAVQLLDLVGSDSKLSVDCVARIDLPQRPVENDIVRDLVRAVFEKSAVEIYYYSINSGTERWRAVSPHALAHDGYRWHVRAWCHEDKAYKDFVFGRMARIRPATERRTKLPIDSDWLTWVTLKFRAHRSLGRIQRAALERDFGMRHGVASVRVRKAMLFYTLAYFGLTEPGAAPTKRLELAGKVSGVDERESGA